VTNDYALILSYVRTRNGEFLTQLCTIIVLVYYLAFNEVLAQVIVNDASHALMLGVTIMLAHGTSVGKRSMCRMDHNYFNNVHTHIMRSFWQYVNFFLRYAGCLWVCQSVKYPDFLSCCSRVQEGLNGVNWLLTFAWIFDWQLTKYPNWQLRNDEKIMSQHLTATDYWHLAIYRTEGLLWDLNSPRDKASLCELRRDRAS
jgi:hypothetical protein